MRIKLGAFPVVFFTARCKRHDCWVSVRPQLSTDRTDQHTIAGQIIAMQCEKGGEPKQANCTDHWEISISGPGDVTVTQQ